MLTQEQRARIRQHLEHGWKLPDSLVLELWSAYESLERDQLAGSPPAARASAPDRPKPGPSVGVSAKDR